MRQTETTGLLARELERLRTEDRRREERLTSLVTQLTEQQKILNKRLDDLTAHVTDLSSRHAALEEKVNSVQTDLKGFEKDLSGLVSSLRKL